MPIKRAAEKARSGYVFGQRRKAGKMFRAGLYARILGKRGPVSGLERLMRSKTNLFGVPFNFRPQVVVAPGGGVGWWLLSGRSGGTLSVGPELIVEIPI